MRSERNLEEVGVPEIIEGIQALFLAPVVLPITAAINQPLVKAAIKEGIALSERCKEALAEAGETFDDLAAEVRAELAEKRQAEPSSESVRTWVREGESEASCRDYQCDVYAQRTGWTDNEWRCRSKAAAAVRIRCDRPAAVNS